MDRRDCDNRLLGELKYTLDNDKPEKDILEILKQLDDNIIVGDTKNNLITGIQLSDLSTLFGKNSDQYLSKRTLSIVYKMYGYPVYAEAMETEAEKVKNQK